MPVQTARARRSRRLRNCDDACRAHSRCRLRRAPVHALAGDVVTTSATLPSAAVLRIGGDAAAGDADRADLER